MNARRRRRADPVLDGVLLLDKPLGPTSHDVVQWVRWALGVRRVGHCGTLDPMATGLLVVGVGRATKLVPYLTGQDKTYETTVALGRRTTTGDAQGEVVDQRPVDASSFDQIPAAVAALAKEHLLPPPAFSAVHVDGRRAHELAREGKDVALEPRPMIVHEAQLLRPARRGPDGVEVDVSLRVSKGTYIRSLGEALGEALGVPAHLSALHRTDSGALELSDSDAVRGLTAASLPGTDGRPPRWRIERSPPAPTDRESLAAFLRSCLKSPAQAIPLPLLRVNDSESGSRALARLASGQPIAVDDPGLPSVPAGDPLAVAPARVEQAGLVVVANAGGELRPQRVIVPVEAPGRPDTT